MVYWPERRTLATIVYVKRYCSCWDSKLKHRKRQLWMYVEGNIQSGVCNTLLNIQRVVIHKVTSRQKSTQDGKYFLVVIFRSGSRNDNPLEPMQAGQCRGEDWIGSGVVEQQQSETFKAKTCTSGWWNCELERRFTTLKESEKIPQLHTLFFASCITST